MTLSDARRILGLGPDDDPRPYLTEFREARERIAEMVRTAPNETLAMRYQQGLVDFDQALASVREHLEAQGLIEPVTEIPENLIPPVEVPVVEAPEVLMPAVEVPSIGFPEPVIDPPAPAAPTPVPAGDPYPFSGGISEEAPFRPPPLPLVPPVAAAEEEQEDGTVRLAPAIDDGLEENENSPAPAPFVFQKPAPKAFETLGPKTTGISVVPKTVLIAPPKKPSKGPKVAWTLGVILLAVAGGLLYLKNEEKKAIRIQERLVYLEREGSIFIDNRRWPEAVATYNEIEKLAPKSVLPSIGRRSIEAGMAEEQSQFVGYWTGQAKASLDAKRWDEAEAAAKQVLDRFPKEPDATALLAEIREGRSIETDRNTISAAREELQQRNWEAAIASASKILSIRPDDEDAKSLLADATAAKEKSAADMAKAKVLLEQARARDQGQFDQEVLNLLREANALAPEDPDIKAHLEKIAAYSRTIKVPGDFATPAEALAQARDRDRIMLGAGTWVGPLVVNASIDIQGAGADTTIIQCDAKTGTAITFGPDSAGTHVSGISFRHLSFDPGTERYSTALVRNSTVDFIDCRFSEGSGHGLAVIEGGHAVISRCRFSDNGWNGIAASGMGSLLEVRQSESLRNFGHGIESWDGAAVILTGNRCEDNSRNGIHADNGNGSVTLEKNQLIANREFGLVLSSAGSGKIEGNVSRGNLLGGYVIRATAAGVSFTENQATKNEGPGLVLDIGLLPAPYASNINTGNGGQQVLLNANLTFKDLSQADPTLDPNPPTPPSRPKPVTKSR